MVNTAEILIRATDDGASATVKSLVAQFDALAVSGTRAGEGMTSGLTKVNTTAPQTEITRLREIVDRLPMAAETAASGANAGLNRITTTASAAEIERLRLLVTQLPARAVEAAGGVDTAMNRIVALEARANMKMLDNAVKALPITASVAATETNRSLATVKTLEAQKNVKTLDMAIKGLITAGETASTGATTALSRLSVRLPEAEITRLKSMIAKLPEDAVTAAGGTNVALNRIVALEAKANLAALNKEIAKLPETSALAAVGVNKEVDSLKWAESKSKVTEWGTNLVEWAKKSAEAVGLIGLAQGGIDFAAIKTASTYQTTLTNNRNNTIMTDADAANMRSTTLGLAPQLGVDPNVLANAFRQAFDLNNNASVTDIILKQSGMSAKSTGDNPEATAVILAQLLHEYGLDKGGPNQEADATRVMGQAHITAASGKMTLPDFSQNFGQISAWGANLGIPMDQLMADFATMSAHGFDPATAATQVKDLMPHIIKPSAGAIKEAGSLDKQVAATGQDDGTSIVSLFSAESISKLGISGTFDELHKKFDILHLDEAQQTEVLLKLVPNMRGGAAAFTTLGQGADDYKKILGNLNNTSLTMNVTQESFNRTQETAAFKWDAFKEKLQVFGIELGDKLLPKVEKLTDWLSTKLPVAVATITKDWKVFTDALAGNWGDAQGNSPIVSFLGTLGLTIRNQVIPAFNDMKGTLTGAFAALQGGTKFLQDHTAAASVLVGVLAGVGTAVAIYKTMEVVTKAWTAAQLLLDIALNANPVALIVVAVAALAAGIIYAYTHSDKFRQIIQEIGTVAKAVGIWLKDTLGSAVQWLGDQFNNLGVTAQRFADWFVKIFGAGGTIGQAFDALGTKANEWIGPGGKVGQFFDNLGGKINEWLGPSGKVGTFFSNFGTIVQTVFWQKAKDFINPVIDFFNTLGSTVGDWLAPGGKVGTFFSNFGTVVQTLWQKAKDFIEPIGGFFDGLGTAIHNVIGPLGDFISKLTGAPGAVGDWLAGHLPGGGGSSPNLGYTTPGTQQGTTYNGHYYAPGEPFHYASGTESAPGGMAWVGERGPELVNLPAGAQVFTADQSRRMASGGTAPTINVYVAGSITTARGMAEDVRTELLRMQRQGIKLGFT